MVPDFPVDQVCTFSKSGDYLGLYFLKLTSMFPQPITSTHVSQYPQAMFMETCYFMVQHIHVQIQPSLPKSFNGRASFGQFLNWPIFQMAIQSQFGFLGQNQHSHDKCIPYLIQLLYPYTPCPQLRRNTLRRP